MSTLAEQRVAARNALADFGRVIIGEVKRLLRWLRP